MNNNNKFILEANDFPPLTNTVKPLSGKYFQGQKKSKEENNILHTPKKTKNSWGISLQQWRGVCQPVKSIKF